MTLYKMSDCVVEVEWTGVEVVGLSGGVGERAEPHVALPSLDRACAQELEELMVAGAGSG